MARKAPTTDPEQLLDVTEIADEFGMGESTVWLFLKRHDLPRFRVPARPRKTLVRRGDVERALTTPVPIGGSRHQRTGAERGKAAA